jgi:hypothetical protein
METEERSLPLPPKLLFAVEQSVSSQILAVKRQQIECKEARWVPTA